MTHQESFASSLHEASSLLEQLSALLREEREVLAQSDAAQTHAVVERKSELLNQLQQNTLQRNQLLVSSGYSADELGTQAFLNSLPQNLSRDLTVKWQALEAKLEDCKQENLVNGKIIHRSRQQVNLLLNLLQGNPDGGSIYTDAGQAKAVNSQQPLAKA